MGTGMNNLDTIWEGDKLQRRSEALLLENFLTSEADVLSQMARDQSFVLALDAQYGEGKSWFLTRFSEQLRLNHPVAFVDAWIDDANNEPLISIMAALDDALQPFLKKKNVKEKLGAVTRAALPIMGKAILGAGGKLVSRYVGDEFGDDAKDVMSAASRGKTSSKKGDDGDPIEAGVEKLVEGVSEVVDNAGKVLLNQYRTRQRSRETFKENLKQLAQAIEATNDDPRHGPIFVIVDELDRCRPSYAISLLEEIKHLFDVPGVVFVIALHGDQLEASVKAVYGNDFDAQSYLRRFFSRHYELRRLSIRELVVHHFAMIPPGTKFSYPETWSGNQIGSIEPADLAGGLLSEWAVTPREAQAIIDALRLFVANWDYNGIPIELPYVLKLLRELVKGVKPSANMPAIKGQAEVLFVRPQSSNDYNNAGPGKVQSSEIGAMYVTGVRENAVVLGGARYDGAIELHLNDIARSEMNLRFQGRYVQGREPYLTWTEYETRVREVGRFVETPEQ